MNGYIISLKEPVEKIKMLKKHKIYVDIIEGVDGAKLTENEMEKNVSWLYSKIGPKSAIGCAMAHMNAWKKFLETNEKYKLIMEDDVIIKEDIEKKIKEGLDKVPEDFDILYLGCFGSDGDNIFKICMRILGMNNKEQIINDNIKIPEVALGLHAYIISRKGAKKLLDNLEGKIYQHLDYCIQELSSRDIIKTYVITPRVAYQTSTYNLSNSNNITANYPLLITNIFDKIDIDTYVKLSYLANVSLIRVNDININLISIGFLILGIIISKWNVIEIFLLFMMISLLDIIYMIKDNKVNNKKIKTIILNYILINIPNIIMNNKNKYK